eukprot:5020919-Prymnesium_polylepis.1
MPLDAHLFADLKTAVSRHVIVTAGLGVEDENRFKIGTAQRALCHPSPRLDPGSGAPPHHRRCVAHSIGSRPDRRASRWCGARCGAPPRAPWSAC